MKVRTVLLAGRCLPLLASPLYAGAARAEASAQSAREPDGAASVSEVVVTGSHIVRDGYDSPMPLTVARTDDLAKAAPTSIPDALNQLPQFTASTSPTKNTNTNLNLPDRGNILNLRGVGGVRTLILMNGLRVAPTSYAGTVNTDTIPQLLVERVEVVTAGASAAYGSDALAGVVNFILDTHYEGLKATAQVGASSRGDAQNFRLGVGAGRSFQDGRGHILLSGEHFQTKNVTWADRSRLAQNWLGVGSVVGSTAAAGTAPNPIDIRNNVRFTLGTYGGNAVSGPFAGTLFTSPGQYRTIIPGQPTGTPNYAIGGDYYSIQTSRELLPTFKTDQLFGRVDYQLADNVNFHAQASGAQVEDDFHALSNIVVGYQIYSGNAFLPPALQAQLTAANAPSFGLTKYFAEFGLLPSHEVTRNYNIVAGLDGKLGGRWSWNLDYTYGRAVMKASQSDLLELAKFNAAMDAVVDPATGRVVCRPILSADPAVRQRYADCVPLNPFGEGAASSQSRDYVTDVSRYRAMNDMHAIAATAQGDLVDLWAGPLAVAVGAEYRRQKLEMSSNADPATPVNITGLRGIAANTTRFFLTNLGSAAGSQSVKEVFGEFALPLLKDAQWANSLDLNGAVRLTDYKTSGKVVTWKVGGAWEPVADLRFRATRSKDIRAPTMYDLFAGRGADTGGGFDRLTGVSAVLPRVTGGNPDLKPEKGETFTVGAVINPSFLPGFSASIDYFDVRVKEAIQGLNSQQILDSCFASNGAAPVCSLIERPFAYSNTTPANYPTLIRVFALNIASLKTSGIDFEASYRTALGNGNLVLRALASYTRKFETQQALDQPAIEYAGYSEGVFAPQIPKFKSTVSATYTLGSLEVFAQERIIGKFKWGPTLIWNEPDIKPVFYTDLTLTKTIASAPGRPKVFLTIQNLFDKDPPIIPPTGGATNLYVPTLPTVYDILGRTCTMGARLSF